MPIATFFEDTGAVLKRIKPAATAGGYLLMCLAGAIGLAFLAYTKPLKRTRPRPIIGNDYPLFRRLQLRLALFVSELTAYRIVASLIVIMLVVSILFCLSLGAITGLIAASIITLCVVGLSKYQGAGLAIAGSTVVLTLALVGWLGLGGEVAKQFESFNDKDALFSEGRFELWGDSLSSFAEFPVLGYGLNAYRDVFRGYRSSPETTLNEYAENQFVQTLVESGIVGFGLLLMALVLMVVAIRFLLQKGSSRKTAAAATIGIFALSSQIVAGSFDFGLYIPANMILMAAICGFVAGQANGLTAQRKDSYRCGGSSFSGTSFL